MCISNHDDIQSQGLQPDKVYYKRYNIYIYIYIYIYIVRHIYLYIRSILSYKINEVVRVSPDVSVMRYMRVYPIVYEVTTFSRLFYNIVYSICIHY